MSSSIEDIKRKILSKNPTAFIFRTGVNLFQSLMTIYRKNSPSFGGVFVLNEDHTLNYFKKPNENLEEGKVVMYYNPDPTSNFQAIFEFESKIPVLIQFFPVILDKFFFTSNGMIYVAKDYDNIFSVQMNTYPNDPEFRDLYKLYSNLEFDLSRQFNININGDRDSQYISVRCGSHNTLTNTPRFISDDECKDAINKNYNQPQLLSEMKNTYCSNFPESNRSDCGIFCSNDSTSCKTIFNDFCKGSNLELESCKQFIAQKNINLDNEVKAYCDSLGTEKAITNDLCGCFMPQSFYDNYFNTIKQAVNEKQQNFVFKDPSGNDIDMEEEISQLSANPTCYFTKCSVSSFFPFKEKSTATKTICPNVTQCVQVNEFDITGKINTDSINYGSQTCIVNPISSNDCIFSDWSVCIDGKQTRTIISKPDGKECEPLSKSCTNENNIIFNIVKIVLVVLVLILVLIFNR